MCLKTWHSWSLTAWVVALCGLIATTSLALLTVRPSVLSHLPNCDYASTITTLGVALTTAVVAWHLRSLDRFRAERSLLLKLLSSAKLACGDPKLDKFEVEASLTDLRDAMALSPLRSQSPAAVSATAGREVVEATYALITSIRGDSFPSTLANVAASQHRDSRLFIAARASYAARPGDFLSAGSELYARLHKELLTGRGTK